MMNALVTGASSGIGRQYATILARDYGCGLILVSNQESALKESAEEIERQYNVPVKWLCIDLAEQNAAEEVYAFAEGIQVDILVNDAGMFFFSGLNETPLGKIESMVMLHVLTLTKLCRMFGADMCGRGSGYILNMSSLCAWMKFPYIQTYCATKDYVLNFSLSLRYELRCKGVNLTVVTPGAVDTPLYNLSDKTRRLLLKSGISITPERLARKALKAMFAGKKRCMPGFINYIARPVCKHLPDWAINSFLRIRARAPLR